MTRRIVTLMACELALVAGGLWIIGHQGVPTDVPVALFIGFAAAFSVLTLLPPLHLELRRHACTVTPSESAMLVALFALGPFGFVASAMLAEGIGALKHRQSPLKTLFNLVHLLGGFVAASTVFSLVGRADPLDPIAWLGGAAALAATAVWDTISTAAVLAFAENGRFGVMVRRTVAPAAISFSAAALLGIAALVLFHETPFGPLLFAPVLAILLISTRGVSQQREERMRFQRLYEASGNLAQLVSLSDMLAKVAREGMGLMTGAAALCCTTRPDGSWAGALVDDKGAHEPSAALLGSLTALASARPQGDAAIKEMPRDARRMMPPCATMMWSSAKAEPAGTVLIVVFREVADQDSERHRADVLSAFAAHAATVVANVGLHEDVQRALDYQVELNQQKSDFVAAVSHELRTPLTVMMGAIQTLQRRGDSIAAEKRETMLDMGMTQGTRLRVLIDDLLLVASSDHQTVKLSREPLDVTDVLTELHAEMAPSIGERLQLLPAHALGIAETDRDKLRRIIANLVVNADKYAPEGPIVVEAVRRERNLTITVTDHGPGIRPEDRERVFERFVQLDQSATRRQGGTGLGLHLCRQLSELLGGTLTVTEADGGGARFVLCLEGTMVGTPSVPPESTAPDPGEAVAPSPVRARPPSVTARPAGVTARPAGVRARPSGVTARPAGVRARPEGVRARPESVAVDQSAPRTTPSGVARSPMTRPAELSDPMSTPAEPTTTGMPAIARGTPS